eukprot:222336-Hanusia_phi.AAC.1
MEEEEEGKEPAPPEPPKIRVKVAGAGSEVWNGLFMQRGRRNGACELEVMDTEEATKRLRQP